MWLGRGRRAIWLAAFFLGAAHAQSEARLEPCAPCHGADGNSVTAGSPSLAGQPKVFLENYLVLSREGLRGPDVMQQLLKGVPDRELVAIAAHYAKLPAKPAAVGAADAAMTKRGRELAQKHRCGSCHRADFRGQQHNPRLAGQREDFLVEVMLAYQQNRRAGGDTLMAAALYGIAESDVRALAHFLARQR